jgi:sugar phosphate isomerase/epimerase
MIRVGAFSDAVRGATPEEVARRSAMAGMEAVQIRTQWPGLDLLGTGKDRARVRRAYTETGIEIAALAAYTNLLTPDVEGRRAAHAQLELVIRLAPEFGTDLVVTETGTFDPDDAWADHPHNHTVDAWMQLVEVTQRLTMLCEREGVRLAYEPYVATVLHSARAARRLADEVASSALWFVFDGAGLTTAQTLRDNSAITAEACELLAGRFALAHADDVRYENGRARWLPLGWGELDTNAVFAGLARAGFDGALIVEHVREDLLPEAVDFCKRRISTS